MTTPSTNEIPDIVVYTVGHGAGDFSDLERRLNANHIQTLVDVRSQPHSSRYPEFSKHELEEAAAAIGLGYRWLGERLGGRPGDPSLLTADGDPDYALIAASEGFAAGLDEVMALARHSTVAVFCAEADPTHCHRSTLIAPAIVWRGVSVTHILGDGSARPYEPTLGI